MVFSSVLFLFRFLPIFMICYFLVPRKMKNLVLFLGSLVFYAWGEPLWVLLLVFSATANYLFGLLIEKYRGKAGAKTALVSSLVLNLGLLFLFKYSAFTAENINALFSIHLPVPNIRLPIGISFYTFQTISYVVDCYWDKIRAQRSYSCCMYPCSPSWWLDPSSGTAPSSRSCPNGMPLPMTSARV